MSNYVVAALYQFAPLPDYQAWREPLLNLMFEQDIKGTLLLAEEGINGTVSGPRKGIDNLLAYIKRDERFKNLEHKESYHSEHPFIRTKVKLKKEIVTLGVPGIDPNKTVGHYVEPKDWNDLISQPDVVLVDTRNTYEYEVGTFAGAIDPKTDAFRDFPNYVAENLDNTKHKKIAMFCTGGIRCEKATAFMLQQGFEEVYHLKGGILKYLEEVPAEKSLWQGECYVFDDRVSVDHKLDAGHYTVCALCDNPVSPESQKSELYKPGVSCPNCFSV